MSTARQGSDEREGREAVERTDKELIREVAARSVRGRGAPSRSRAAGSAHPRPQRAVARGGLRG